jgi:hypothetical protein
MRKFLTARPSPSHALGILVACAAWLWCAGAAVAQAPAPTPRDADAAMRQAKSSTPATPADDDEEDDDESESTARSAPASAQPRASDPATVMRTARLVYVNSDSVFVNAREVEAALLKRKEFRAWGMAVTRNPSEADLIIEITRKSLRRRFTFTVVDPRTLTVVTSGQTRSVLFGKKIPTKIAEKFTNRLRTVRPYPPASAP